MRLRRSVLNKPGVGRKRRGAGFVYYGPDGDRIDDAETLQRIKDLVIPPAWKKVWIAPYPNGHIRAVGTDAAGRRQYLYHPAWQQERAEEKFDRVLELATQLPALRARITQDLTGRAWRAAGYWRWHCSCSITAISVPVGSSTPRKTSPTGLPPCCANM